MSPFHTPAAENRTGSGLCWAILLPGRRKLHWLGSLLGHFTARLPEITLAQGFVGHIACCVSSLPTTSLPIADFTCNLPDFLAFLIGIGRMKIFHSFSPKTNSLFGLLRKYPLHMPKSAQQIPILATLLYILTLSKHIPPICPKLALRPARLSFKASVFPGERLHS